MEYAAAVNYLGSLHQSRPKRGTETTADALDYLGNPHRGVDYIQIAGSNGKGSTAKMVEQILRSSGLDVGLYTSPDLNDVRERIQINGRKIPKSYLTSFVERLQPYIAESSSHGEELTYFEVLTVLAFEYFGAQDVDVAVLEVGIGGRYDATSVADPIASAVTSVSLEHTDILGETIGEIARDKAQVAPRGNSLVTGATGDALVAIREEAEVITVGADDADILAHSDGLATPTTEDIFLRGPNWDVEAQIPMLGEHQATNAGIAATLARQVADVDTATIADGLQRAQWPGRFEIMESAPYVVLDGAHNPAASSELATLVERYDYTDLHLVYGALRDKNHEEMIENLPELTTVTVCRPEIDRAESTDALERIAERQTTATVDTSASVLTAVERAIKAASPGDFVLVSGSLYTVSEARDRWTRLQIPKRPVSAADREMLLENSQISPTDSAAVMDTLTQQTIKTSCRPPQARQLKEYMQLVGGTAATSTVADADRQVDVILTGSRGQFQQLTTELQAGPGELMHIGSQISSLLEIRDEEDTNRFWDGKPAIMGILNITPDSFHDGGEYNSLEEVVTRAEQLIADGAAILDVGGESTRPGADPVSTEKEIERVVPAIERLSDLSVPISVDTRKPVVAAAAIQAGADIVNDVSGLENPEMRRIIAENDVRVVIMHSLDTPVNPDRSVAYDDVVEDVLEDLAERVLLAERAGIDREQIIIDPGIGFGKDAAESFELIDRLYEFRALRCPVLLGHSHKSMFGSIDCDPDNRLAPTIATTALAVERGASIIRVHDVAENVAAIRSAMMVRRQVEME